MSRADELFIQNCRDILENGVWDTDREVRPHWEDGTPAHTVKKFGIVNRYDLQAEFPILTIRRTYWKTAVKELLWIWQKKSNNIHDLDAKIPKRGRLQVVIVQELPDRWRAERVALLAPVIAPGIFCRKFRSRVAWMLHDLEGLAWGGHDGP